MLQKLEKLAALTRELDALLIKHYTEKYPRQPSEEDDVRPAELVAILCSVSYMGLFYHGYKQAVENGDSLLYNASRSLTNFEKHTYNLVDQLQKTIDETQIFKDHEGCEEILAILEQMLERAKELKDVSLSSMIPNKPRTGSISDRSEGESTDTGTPASKTFPRNNNVIG